MDIRKLCSQCGIHRAKDRYTRCSYCRGKEHDLCSCGQRKTKRAKVCAACNMQAQRGGMHNCWKGGRVQLKDGYVRAWAPSHPRAVNARYVLEHILVMEGVLGRYLHPDERVHHRNKVRDDNRPENLELWSVGHPCGARVEDLLDWAHEIIARYES